jgi:cell division protein FtsB
VTVVELLEGGVTLASVIAGAAYGFISRDIRTLQKQEIEALRDTNKRLEETNTAMLARINTLEGQVSALQGIVTQAPEIKSLAGETLHQHQEVLGVLGDIVTALRVKAL